MILFAFFYAEMFKAIVGVLHWHPLENWSFHIVVLQRTAMKPTGLYFARVVSLCCSLTLFFGAVLVDVVVVVFLSSPMSFHGIRNLHATL